jgi:branched-subunit amino acid transport protein AzlD
MNGTYVVSVIVAMAIVTFALRALPFVAAQWLQKHSVVQRLGEFLPLAIMTLLVVHSAAGSAQQHAGGPWPELAAVALTVAVQWRRRNALFSIALGTALYVALRNYAVF